MLYKRSVGKFREHFMNGLGFIPQGTEHTNVTLRRNGVLLPHELRIIRLLAVGQHGVNTGE
jgi:hypothetical protein